MLFSRAVDRYLITLVALSQKVINKRDFEAANFRSLAQFDFRPPPSPGLAALSFGPRYLVRSDESEQEILCFGYRLLSSDVRPIAWADG